MIFKSVLIWKLIRLHNRKLLQVKGREKKSQEIWFAFKLVELWSLHDGEDGIVFIYSFFFSHLIRGSSQWATLHSQSCIIGSFSLFLSFTHSSLSPFHPSAWVVCSFLTRTLLQPEEKKGWTDFKWLEYCHKREKLFMWNCEKVR